MAPENFGGKSGVGEVSVPFPLMNRVKKPAPEVICQTTPECSEMPHRLGWVFDKSREGEYFITEKRLRE